MNERPEGSTPSTQDIQRLRNASSNANSHFMGGRLSANQVRRLINLWPPLLFSGIRVRFVAEDWSRIDVELRLSWLNRNGVGVMFGGTLFSMADPFLPLMLQHRLGPDYAVWTKSAEIEFLRPGKDLARASFQVTESDAEAIRAATAQGGKHLPVYSTDITDSLGESIARVKSVMYVRKKRAKPIA